MSSRKPCLMPFRKLIPPFTLTAKLSIRNKKENTTNNKQNTKQNREDSAVLNEHFDNHFLQSNKNNDKKILLYIAGSSPASCRKSEIICALDLAAYTTSLAPLTTSSKAPLIWRKLVPGT